MPVEVKRRFDEGWTTYLLVAGTQLCLAMAVTAAGWTEGLGAAPVISWLATLTGLACAKSRFRTFFSTVIATAYGSFLVGLALALQIPDADTWLARVSQVVGRIAVFIGKVLSGGTSRDNLIFVVLVFTLTWIFGVVASWAVFRRGRAWQALLPAGLALMNNVYYYNGPGDLEIFVAVYVLLALLLLARTHLHQHEAEWQASRVAFSPELRFDFLRAGLVVALLVLLAAWRVPVTAANSDVATVWGRFTGPWNSFREGFVRLFSSLKAYGQPTVDYYGDSLVLSGSVDLTDREVMDVVTAERGPLGRYYWRARAYDRYDDGRWTATEGQHRLFVPEEEDEIRLVAFRQRGEALFTFVSHTPAMRVLYVTGQPRWLSRPTDLEFTTGASAPVDVTVVRAQQMLEKDESYDLLSAVSLADERSLRGANRAYPDWVRARYLQLPPSVTERTVRLAREITAGAQTPYDQAQAITEWLRANIRYNQRIEAPPSGVDPVDWLLFDSREGYCNYYASAEVVMLRSLGLPARLAVGFAEGEYDAGANAYRVKEFDAHAWPEVFFPGYGWVEFEPTASELPIERPEEPVPIATPDGSGSSWTDSFESHAEAFDREKADDPGVSDPAAEAAAQGSGRWLKWVWAGLAALAAAVLLLLAWWLAEYGEVMGPARRLTARALGRGLRAAGVVVPERYRALLDAEAADLSPASLAYARVLRGARWMGLRVPPAFTPHERVEMLASALPEGREPAGVIVDEYVSERFGRASGDPDRVTSAWNVLRPKVWVESLRRRMLQLMTEAPRR